VPCVLLRWNPGEPEPHIKIHVARLQVTGTLKVPVGKGSRLIVCHVGSTLMGFVPETKWVFRSKSTKDYHEEMMADTFKDWFFNRFINYFEEDSIIIMDNARYHSVTLNKVPYTSLKNKISSTGWNGNKLTLQKQKQELSQNVCLRLDTTQKHMSWINSLMKAGIIWYNSLPFIVTVIL
jgi:hypothetical protein